jgi:DNA-binding transcriptional MerR regulator
MLTPKQTSETLQVSTSTIRRWSIEFVAFLGHRTGVKRQYSTEDVATLARIRDLFKQGYSSNQIHETLPTVDRSKNDKALVNIADFATALSLARADNSKLNQMVTDMNTRLDTLEKWLSLPWYARMGKRPPIA